jgi:DNA-binding transcriptional LysR family regulator
MEKDQLDGLLAFKLVAEKRNFTSASDELNISTSAISQMITQLEKRMRVALFTRTTRSVSLTEAGGKFYEQISPALEQILVAQEQVRSFGSKPSGLLRLNMPRVLYSTYLAPFISSFIEKYPEITLELHFEDQSSDVFENGFDAGIRLSDILAKDMVAIKLFGPIHFTIAASPKYLNKHGRPKHPKDLLTHNCLRTRLGSYIYERWEFEDKGKEFQVQVKGSMIFNDSLIMMEAALDGAGLIYATEEAIRKHVKSGRLEIVLEKYKTTSDGFYLYFPKKAQVLPKLRAFIEHFHSMKNKAKA